jgi:hypothetical protein
MNHLERSTRSNGKERTFVRCTVCNRTQTATDDPQGHGLGSKGLDAIGWAETENGWFCPFHSDKGTAGLFAVFEK